MAVIAYLCTVRLLEYAAIYKPIGVLLKSFVKMIQDVVRRAHASMRRGSAREQASKGADGYERAAMWGWTGSAPQAQWHTDGSAGGRPR